MTQTMLERAARALCRSQLLRDPPYSLPGSESALDRAVENTCKFYTPDARAVLMAVREPDEAMSKAVRTTEGWEDMIDAILNEGEK